MKLEEVDEFLSTHEQNTGGEAVNDDGQPRIRGVPLIAARQDITNPHLRSKTVCRTDEMYG